MYDMDVEAVEMGGIPSFFVDDYEKYSWKHLFDPKLGGADKVQLYSDAIENMYTNPSAPQLFREIFKNSFLPFKDPSTLNMFLKEINEFHYSHSEKLGDAFEYLLSFMGSQGDAGQFRTPRHIIDFIVEIVNPQKNETILDPACGTAGFLISSYKHILSQNTDKKLGDKLNASDRKQVGDNLVGYDISPDMTRISLVNMYLHQFASPQIHEYDTLSSEDRWNEYYDVILANPPFFSPTGGIQPHTRFGVQSTRAEVLFVDYIIEHLKPTGRAGIVVPEGIIFQTGTAYKTLRKKLVEDCLVGVISLPAGVFQPYSGVKTSILILDKELNQKSDSIFFAKVENDGFSLGAQRTPIAKNDLPTLTTDIVEYLNGAANNSLDTKSKQEIADDGLFSLSYSKKVSTSLDSDFPLVTLGDLCDLYQPKTITQKDLIEDGKFVVFGANGIIGRYDQFNHENPEVIVTCRGNTCGTVNMSQRFSWITGNAMVCSPKETRKLTKEFLFYCLDNSDLSSVITGSAQPQITRSSIEKFSIPLPPIEVQQQIVDELEGYQKIIDGCKQVIENYKPTIDIDPSWEMVELGEICEIKSGGTPSKKNEEYWSNGTVPWVGSGVCKNGRVYSSDKFITTEGLNNSSAKVFPTGTTFVALVGATIGKTALSMFETSTNQNIAGLTPKNESQLDRVYLFYAAQTLYHHFMSLGDGQFRMANLSFVRELKIPLPSIDVQKKIVSSLEEVEQVIEGNKNLITVYSQKIQDRISKVWGK